MSEKSEEKVQRHELVKILKKYPNSRVQRIWYFYLDKYDHNDNFIERLRIDGRAIPPMIRNRLLVEYKSTSQCILDKEESFGPIYKINANI